MSELTIFTLNNEEDFIQFINNDKLENYTSISKIKAKCIELYITR